MWHLGIWPRGDCGGADCAVGCLRVGLDDPEVSSKDDSVIMCFCKKEKRPTQNLNLYFNNYSSLSSHITYLNLHSTTNSAHCVMHPLDGWLSMQDG